MPENIAHCPLCGSASHSDFAKTNFCGHQVLNRICEFCGFVFQSPRMNAAELDAFYVQEYRRVYHGASGINPKDVQTQIGRAGALLAFVIDRVPVIRSHLDIGCSAGILLEKFSMQYACISVGVEPGEAYREFAQAKGFHVYRDISEVQITGSQSFDLISMAHVLEHIPDPVAYLCMLRAAYLAPAGCLLLEVPNLYAHDSFEIAHMSSFSEHTLRQALRRSGYQVVSFRKHGSPRSKILPLYLTVLARVEGGEGSSLIVPESGVRRKRRNGMFRRRLLQKLLPKLAWTPIEEAELVNQN